MASNPSTGSSAPPPPPTAGQTAAGSGGGGGGANPPPSTDEHLVVGNDYISRLAKNAGYKNWKTLWDKNPELAAKRSNPFILFHGDSNNTGDVIKLPKPKKKESAKQTNAHHKFKAKSDQIHLRLRVVDENFDPLPADTKYSLYVTFLYGEDLYPLNGAGVIDVPILRDDAKATLFIEYQAEDENQQEPWPKVIQGVGAAAAPAPPPAPAPQTKPITVKFELAIGRLNPVLEQAPDAACVSGMQQRLNNIGFDAGRIDGVDDDDFKAAIRRFQRRFKITVNGQSDQPTQQAMRDFHDNGGAAPAP